MSVTVFAYIVRTMQANLAPGPKNKSGKGAHVQQMREADASESEPRTVHRGTLLLSKHGQKAHKGPLAAAHHKASLLPAVSVFVRN